MNDEQTPTSSVSATRSMLRWYPSRWRSRYGREFAAMVEDDLAGRSPTMRYRLSLARSGLNERLHESGLVGNSAPPEERIRDGSLTVLCAFALFVLPGIGFAKISEHWDQSFHGGARRLSATSFDLLAVVAVVCAASVVIAAIAIVPTAVQFVRIGGWPAIRRRVVWAVTATLATAAVGGGLVGWARHLTTHQRNAGFGWYQILVRDRSNPCGCHSRHLVSRGRCHHPPSPHRNGSAQGGRDTGCYRRCGHADHDRGGSRLVGIDGSDRSLVPRRNPCRKLAVATCRQPARGPDRDDGGLRGWCVRTNPGHWLVAPVTERLRSSAKSSCDAFSGSTPEAGRGSPSAERTKRKLNSSR